MLRKFGISIILVSKYAFKVGVPRGRECVKFGGGNIMYRKLYVIVVWESRYL